MPKQELFDVCVKLKHETEKAILVVDADNKEVWLPKSQVEFEKQPDGTCIVTGPEWLLQDKELI